MDITCMTAAAQTVCADDWEWADEARERLESAEVMAGCMFPNDTGMPEAPDVTLKYPLNMSRCHFVAARRYIGDIQAGRLGRPDDADDVARLFGTAEEPEFILNGAGSLMSDWAFFRRYVICEAILLPGRFNAAVFAMKYAAVAVSRGANGRYDAGESEFAEQLKKTEYGAALIDRVSECLNIGADTVEALFGGEISDEVILSSEAVRIEREKASAEAVKAEDAERRADDAERRADDAERRADDAERRADGLRALKVEEFGQAVRMENARQTAQIMEGQARTREAIAEDGRKTRAAVRNSIAPEIPLADAAGILKMAAVAVGYRSEAGNLLYQGKTDSNAKSISEWEAGKRPCPFRWPGRNFPTQEAFQQALREAMKARPHSAGKAGRVVSSALAEAAERMRRWEPEE